MFLCASAGDTRRSANWDVGRGEQGGRGGEQVMWGGEQVGRSGEQGRRGEEQVGRGGEQVG